MAVQRLRERLLLPVGVLAVTHVVGTLGFWWTWRGHGASLFDGLFMTFITIATIGYGEVYPLDAGGRIVAMLVAAGGIGTVGYTFGVVLDFLVNEQLTGARKRYRMLKHIEHLRGHTILAGMGRVGREAADELTGAGKQWVLIDPSEEVVREAVEQGFLAVRGDASDDETLRRAGVANAAGLVVTTDSDATNLYVVLSARLLNPNLFIVSRAVDEASVPKLVRAGANRAISPYAIGGRRLAHLMISPRAVDFFETALRSGDRSLSIGDVEIPQVARAVGQTLGALQPHGATGATVLAVLRGGTQIVTPSPDVKLMTGDHLLGLGTAQQLEALERLLTT